MNWLLELDAVDFILVLLGVSFPLTILEMCAEYLHCRSQKTNVEERVGVQRCWGPEPVVERVQGLSDYLSYAKEQGIDFVCAAQLEVALGRIDSLSFETREKMNGLQSTKDARRLLSPRQAEHSPPLDNSDLNALLLKATKQQTAQPNDRVDLSALRAQLHADTGE